MADDTTASTESPWDSDLATAFEDEGTRTAVSEFLGEKVQPYVTKLEQDSKETRDANLLWEQFHESPTDTTVQVIRELYGPEYAEKFSDMLTNSDETVEADDLGKGKGSETEPAPTDTEIEFNKLPKQVQEVVERDQVEASRKAYYEEIDRVKEEHKDELPKDVEGKPKLDVDTFHPFVVAAEGNFDAAYDGFQKWIAKAREEFGVAATVDENGKPEPPAAINSQTRDASTKPPVVKTGQTLDDAMDDMFNEMKAPPPTVGAV